MSPDQAESARLLRRLARGLEKREPLHSGAAREGLDVHLIELVERLKTLVSQTQAEDVTKPPRSASLPLAMALYSQPHLDITFGAPRWQSTDDRIPPELPEPDSPVLFAPDLVKEVLGLEDWELDELREEVDRRVGNLLKQERALDWLWTHFGLPEASPDRLFRVLFPGAPRNLGGPVGMIRYGAQLYAVIDQNPMPPRSALYLGWLQSDQEYTFAPLGTFRARYVDPNLRRSMARAIGASDTEVLDLLDAMVTIIPRQAAAAFLSHDQWRITGVAAMSSLGSTYATGDWLNRVLAPNDLYVKDFLELSDAGRLQLRKPEASFDAYANARTSSMLNNLYAEMLARIAEEDHRSVPKTQITDLSLYDIQRHLKRILQPLLAWADSDETVPHVARVFGVPEDEARTQVQELATRWRQRAETFWWGAPSHEEPHTVLATLLVHVISSHNSLRHAFRRDTRVRIGHRNLLMLFAAHYYAEASVGRLLKERAGMRTDPIASWFWGVWNRLIAANQDMESTYSGPHPFPT